MPAQIHPFPAAPWQSLLNTGPLPYNKGVWACHDGGCDYVFWSARFSDEAASGEAYEIDGSDRWIGPSEIHGWSDDEATARRAAALIAIEYGEAA